MSAEQRTPLRGTSAQMSDSEGRMGQVGGLQPGFSREPRPAPVWPHRLGVLLFVFFCAVLGVILIIFPWRDEWMTNNTFLFGHPALQDFLVSGFVRGLCSGLGVIDIWIGFWEAVHYHE